MIGYSKKNRENYPRECLKHSGLKFSPWLPLTGVQTAGPRLKRSSKSISSNSFKPLSAQNKDIGTALQMLLSRVKLHQLQNMMVCPAGQFWFLASALNTDVQFCHCTPKQDWKVEHGLHRLGGNSKIGFWIVPSFLKRVLLGKFQQLISWH